MKPRMLNITALSLDYALSKGNGKLRPGVTASINIASVSLAWIDSDNDLHLVLNSGREIVCTAYSDVCRALDLYLPSA